jgi:DNA-binding FadR family transcriptional regulator
MDLLLNEEGNPLEISKARRIIEPENAKVAAHRRVKRSLPVTFWTEKRRQIN